MLRHLEDEKVVYWFVRHKILTAHIVVIVIVLGFGISRMAYWSSVVGFYSNA
jgi:hypothetical protein